MRYCGTVAQGRRVRAILPVHILGHPADLDPILSIAAKYSLPVIEDATEGLGARYRGKSVGGIGHLGCFSFNGNKIITTGGGGMLVTNNAEWAARAKYLTTQAKDDPIEYVHNAVGYNYRLTNVLAAMGCAQMEQLDGFVEAKRQIAKRYQESLADLPGIQLPEEAGWGSSTFWMYTVMIDDTRITHQLARASPRAGRLENPGTSRSGSRFIAHRLIVLPPAPSCPNSEALHRQAISLPCSVGLISFRSGPSDRRPDEYSW